MARIQDIDDVCQAICNVVAAFEQVLVPFIRAIMVAFMAIHSWEGFRRIIGGDATSFDSAVHTLNLQHILSVSRSENITANPHLPQAALVKEMEKLLRSEQ